MPSNRVSFRLLAAPPLAFSFVLCGCADSRGGTIPYDRVLPPPGETHVQTLPEDYKISPLDKLTIKVFKADDVSGDYQVDLAGHISMPLIGEVEAANLTTAQLDKKLASLLGQKYFEHPDVSVAIKESTGNVVTVDGAVTQAGEYPIGGPVTLIQAVSLAHGTTPDANPRRVAVFRTIDGKRQAAEFDLTSIRRGQGNDPQIYPGDIIVVDGSRIKEVERQVLNTIPFLSIFKPF